MSKKQKSGGRPPLTTGKRSKVVNVRFTEEEFRWILNLEKELGIRTTDLVRSRVLDHVQQRVINAHELIALLSTISTEMARSGNNINQLAKYANSLIRQNILSAVVIERYLLLHETYTMHQARLELTLRKVIRLMANPAL